MPFMQKCQECGITFHSKDSVQKYCSRKCYLKAMKKLYAENKPKKHRFQKQDITNALTLKQVLEYLKEHPEILKNQPSSLTKKLKKKKKKKLEIIRCWNCGTTTLKTEACFRKGRYFCTLRCSEEYYNEVKANREQQVMNASAYQNYAEAEANRRWNRRWR